MNRQEPISERRNLVKFFKKYDTSNTLYGTEEGIIFQDSKR